ncbi:MAG: hypothetical protein IJZ35_03670 [Clostridia bacterium]|nr:hypothetical protein [Clostridia bacterium]
MKKAIILILSIFVVCLFTACSDNTDNNDAISEVSSDEISSQLNNNNSTEDASSSVSSSLKLEDISSAYVEPTFRIVTTVAECYDYAETDDDDTVKTDKDVQGRVSVITVTDKDGSIKTTTEFSYEDSILVKISYYDENGEVFEKIVFSFYDEDSLSVASYVDSESKMSLYFYNEDGTFKSYVDGAGLSALLTSAVMQGIGGAFSQ